MNQKNASARLKFGLGLLDTFFVLVISGLLLIFLFWLSGIQIQKPIPLIAIIGKKTISVVVVSFLIPFWRAQYRGLIPMPNYPIWILIVTSFMFISVKFLTPKTKPDVVMHPNPIEKRNDAEPAKRREIIPSPIVKFKITGTVKSVDGSPVDSVKVYLENSYSTYTNSQGCFTLNFPSKNGQILNFHFNKYGYETYSDDFSMPHTDNIEVKLTKLK